MMATATSHLRATLSSSVKRIDAGSPTICSDEEFYSDDNLASDWHRH